MSFVQIMISFDYNCVQHVSVVDYILKGAVSSETSNKC